MDNQIEKFDPSKLMEGVKDRIKATFVSLIPDDAWEQMLEKELYVFTTGRIVSHHDIDYEHKDENGHYLYTDWEERIPYSDTPTYDNWGHVKEPATISPLRRMIRDILYERFQQDLKEFLNEGDYKQTFDEHGKPEISKAIQDILVNNADTMFQSFLGSVLQQAFWNFKGQIQASIQTGNFQY